MTNRTQINAEQTFKQFVGNERKRKQGIPAELGDGNGVITHPTRSGFVKARLYGDSRQIVSVRDAVGVPAVEDLPILVEKVITEGKIFYKYVGRNDDQSFASDPMTGTVGSHATQHLRGDYGTGGFDPVDVYNRALIEVRAQAQATPNMTVYITPGPYIVDGVGHEWAGGSTAAFVAPADTRCDLIYLGSDHALHVLAGTDMAYPPTKPTAPANVFRVAWIQLTSATTAITETEIGNAKIIGSQDFPATLPPSAHDILSASHGDTLTGSVVDGDTIIGNVTPKWSRLAIAIPAAGVLNYLGVNNAELRPSWKSASNDPGAAAAILASAPTTGLLTLAGLRIKDPGGRWMDFNWTQISGQDAPGGSGLNGVAVSIFGGAADGAATGGNVYLEAGSGGAANGMAGDTSVASGTGGATGGDGGILFLTAGNAIGGNGNGGPIIIQSGVGNGAGGDGNISMRVSGKTAVVYGLNLLTGADKVFTFPDVTGTFALGAGALTVATANDVTVAAHTHTITSSSNPGAAAAILATNSSGDITIAHVFVTSIVATNPGSYGYIFYKDATPTKAWAFYIGASDEWGIAHYDGASWHDGIFYVAPTGYAQFTNTIDTNLANATTNAVDDLLILSHNSTGTAANGFGSRMLWQLASSTTADQSAALLAVEWVDATHASRKARLTLSAYDTAVRNGITIEGDGSNAVVKIASGGTLLGISNNPGTTGALLATDAGGILKLAYLYNGTNVDIPDVRMKCIGYSTVGTPLQLWGDDSVVGTYMGRDGSNVMYMSQLNYGGNDFEFRGTHKFVNNIGFFNHASVAQQTGDIVAGLNNLGLFTAASLKLSGIHHSTSITYISGTGTPGADNTAQTVKTLTLAANTLTQVGDRMRIRCYWTGDTGSPVTGSCKVGPAGSEVLVSHTTDGGAATLQLNEVWLHYIDNTHANIIENEAGALGALSAPNVAGFTWNGAQAIIFTQDAIANNHTILYALIVDVLPKGV